MIVRATSSCRRAHTGITSQQMESFFMGIAQDPELPGYEDFEKQAWGFKVRFFLQLHAEGVVNGFASMTDSTSKDVYQTQLLEMARAQGPLGRSRPAMLRA